MNRSIPVCTKMNVMFAVAHTHILEGIVIPKLCHGDKVIEVQYADDDVDACDAVVTENRELALGIRTADCASVCFSDGTKVGIAHIGWRGLCLGLIEKMLKEFDTARLEIFVGPHLHSFEIQKDHCYKAIIDKFGERFLKVQEGKILFHFKDAMVSLLPLQTQFDERNTGTDTTLPSHRRDKTIKRLITVVQFKL